MIFNSKFSIGVDQKSNDELYCFAFYENGLTGLFRLIHLRLKSMRKEKSINERNKIVSSSDANYII